MLKVLIADDENKVCQLIQALVDWEALDMQVAAAAENGLEAMELIRKHHPDIVITDIRMPGYDGLELVRMGKEYEPRMEFVIISGYRHFEYAQSAIQYGVNAYLLKPIRRQELMETLGRLGEKFREKTDQLSREEQVQRILKNDEAALRQSFLTELIYRRNKELLSWPLERVNEEYHYHLSPGLLLTGILKLDGSICHESGSLAFMAEKARSVLNQLFCDCTEEYELAPEGSFFYLFFNYREDQGLEIRRQLKVFLDEMRVQSGILQDLAVTLSVGHACACLKELGVSLKHARLLMEERLIGGTGRLYEGELPAGEPFTDSELFGEFNMRMSQALETLEVFPVREAMLQLKTRMLAAKGVTGHEILQMTKEVCNLYLFFMKNYRIRIEEDFLERFQEAADSCASGSELFDCLIRRITASYERAARLKRQDENRPIRLVKQYIAEHYREALTLEEVSSVAQLSPAYLSTVFKKDTGMTFLEYLSRVRMDMAKQLLKETSDTVASICEQVGYSDVRYFTKSFTKYSGLKPNEYRKLYS